MAVDAVRAGQAVLLAGLRRRCPVGATRELIESIHATPPVVTPRGVRGRVVVGSDHALAEEYGTDTRPAHPFVRPTKDHDGRRAEAAMKSHMRRFI